MLPLAISPFDTCINTMLMDVVMHEVLNDAILYTVYITELDLIHSCWIFIEND